MSREGNAGQAVVEYVLMVALSLALVAALGTGFRKAIVTVWSYYIHRVSAACPSCPSNYRIP